MQSTQPIDAPQGRGPESTLLGLRFRSLSLPSGDIAYIDQGSGPTILLLHGAPLTALGFVRVIRELEADYRVIAPDFPGFGQSTRGSGFSGSLADYAQFTEDFCRALGLRSFFVYLNDSSACIGLVGLSRLANDVAGIVVASTVPLPLTGRIRLVKFALKHVVGSPPIRFLNRRLNLLPWLVATVAPFSRPFPRAERRALIAQFDTAEKRKRILDVFGQMGRDDAFMRLAASRAREHFARTPVLLLYGQFDPMRLLGAVSRFKRMFPAHAVRIIPFEEHFPILASGGRVAAAVDAWIRDLALR